MSMNEADMALLARIREVQLAHKAKPNDWASDDYIPWACWGYRGGWLNKESGPFVTLNGETDDDRAAGARLIAAGLLDGCMCGCRGDMMVTHDGLRALGVEFDPADVDDGWNPSTVWKQVDVTINADALDEWRASLS